jgi:hypothetical protein
MGQTYSEAGNVTESWWKIPLEKSQTGRSKRRWEYRIKKDIRKTGCEGSRQVKLPQDRVQLRASESAKLKFSFYHQRVTY